MSILLLESAVNINIKNFRGVKNGVWGHCGKFSSPLNVDSSCIFRFPSLETSFRSSRSRIKTDIHFGNKGKFITSVWGGYTLRCVMTDDSHWNFKKNAPRLRKTDFTLTPRMACSLRFNGQPNESIIAKSNAVTSEPIQSGSRSVLYTSFT